MVGHIDGRLGVLHGSFMERMDEMCVANSSSSCDNISFTGSVYGGSPFRYGFFNIF